MWKNELHRWTGGEKMLLTQKHLGLLLQKSSLFKFCLEISFQYALSGLKQLQPFHSTFSQDDTHGEAADAVVYVLSAVSEATSHSEQVTCAE